MPHPTQPCHTVPHSTEYTPAVFNVKLTKKTSSYTAYVLTEASRAKLLEIFPPQFARVICHHITVNPGVKKDSPVPDPASIRVVGYASDESLECLICTVNDTTKRADGKVFHVTLSLGEGRKPVDSNKVIANGWTPVAPFEIETMPQKVAGTKSAPSAKYEKYIYHEGYGVFSTRDMGLAHGELAHHKIPRIKYDDIFRGFADIYPDDNTVNLHPHEDSSPDIKFVPDKVAKYYQKRFKGYEIKGSYPPSNKLAAESEDDSGHWAGENDSASGILPVCPSTKRVCLAWRSKDVHEGDCWGGTGGAVKSGMKPAASARQELIEETGCQEAIKLIPAYEFRDGDFTYFNYIGIVEEEFELNAKKKHEWENDFQKWFTLDELKTEMEDNPKEFHPGFLEFLTKDFDKIKESLEIKKTASQVIERDDWVSLDGNNRDHFSSGIKTSGIKTSGFIPDDWTQEMITTDWAERNRCPIVEGRVRLYHGTPAGIGAVIQQEGLHNRAYLAQEPKDAYEFSRRSHKGRIVVFECWVPLDAFVGTTFAQLTRALTPEELSLKLVKGKTAAIKPNRHVFYHGTSHNFSELKPNHYGIIWLAERKPAKYYAEADADFCPPEEKGRQRLIQVKLAPRAEIVDLRDSDNPIVREFMLKIYSPEIEPQWKSRATHNLLENYKWAVPYFLEKGVDGVVVNDSTCVGDATGTKGAHDALAILNPDVLSYRRPRPKEASIHLTDPLPTLNYKYDTNTYLDKNPLLYHGTRKQFEVLQPNRHGIIWLGEKDTAKDYAEGMINTEEPDAKGRLIRVRLKPDAKIIDLRRLKDPIVREFSGLVMRAGELERQKAPQEQWHNNAPEGGEPMSDTPELREAWQELATYALLERYYHWSVPFFCNKGVDAVIVKDIMVGRHDSIAVFNPDVLIYIQPKKASLQYENAGIPEDVMETYSYGYCTRLAIALGERFHWPIKVAFENDIIIHAWVETPDGRGLDIAGWGGHEDFLSDPRVNRVSQMGAGDLEELVGANAGEIAEANQVIDKYIIPGYMSQEPKTAALRAERNTENRAKMEAFKKSMEFPLTVYRAVDVPPDQVNMERLGSYWAVDENNAMVHFGDNKKTPTILRARVREDDIDWEETFLQNIRYGWGETEVYVKPKSGIYLTGIQHGNGIWEVPEQQYVFASHEPKTAELDDAYYSHDDDQQAWAEAIIEEYESHIKQKNYRQKWTLVPASRLIKIWQDYTKVGFVRDEKGINDIASTIIDNINKLEVNTILCGHTPSNPSTYAEEIMGKPYPEDYFDILDNFFDDENGAWRISDYAMDKLSSSAIQLRRETKAEDKLQVIDYILSIVHCRSDLSSWLVQGGRATLNKLYGANKSKKKGSSDEGFEKTAAKPAIMYHGTYFRNLQSILSQGLIPTTKDKNWGEDKDVSMNQHSRVSYGGIYLTANLSTALSAPRNYYHKDGRMVLVIAEIQPNTLLADEDSISTGSLDRPLGGASDVNYHIFLKWIALTCPNVPLEYKESLENRRTDYIAGYVKQMAYMMEQRGAPMHPNLKLRLNGLVGKCFEASLARRAAHAAHDQQKSGYIGYDFNKAYYDVMSYNGDKVDRENIPPVETIVPTIAEGEAKFREACEKVTRALAITTRPTSKENSSLGIFDSARVEGSIGYNGSNHILAVLEVRSGRQYQYKIDDPEGWQGESTVTPIVVHYLKQGTNIPADFMEKWKTSQGYKICWLKPGENPPTPVSVEVKTSSVTKTAITLDETISKADGFHALQDEWNTMERLVPVESLGAFGKYTLDIAMENPDIYIGVKDGDKYVAFMEFVWFKTNKLVRVSRVGVMQAYQGIGLMPKLYAHLLKSKVFDSIQSDYLQSFGGKSVWQQLAKEPGIHVFGWHKSTKEPFYIEQKDIDEDEVWDTELQDLLEENKKIREELITEQDPKRREYLLERKEEISNFIGGDHGTAQHQAHYEDVTLVAQRSGGKLANRLLNKKADAKTAMPVQNSSKTASPATTLPQLFYRGTNPEDTRRIRTGNDFWDSLLFVTDDPKKARNYGSQVDTYQFKPEAKVLREHTREFNRLGRWKKGESLLDYCSRLTLAAKEAGYDAVYFTMQGDVGTAVINRDSIEKLPETKTASTNPAFDAWFAGSKVVDAQGNPLRCYHGTRVGEDFDEFSVDGPPVDDYGEPSSSGSGGDPSAYLGAHFSVEPEVASSFALSTVNWMKTRYDGEDQRPRVIPVYLNIKNPKNFGDELNLHSFIYEGKLNGYASEDSLKDAMYANGIQDEDSQEAQDWWNKYDTDVVFRKEQNEWALVNANDESAQEIAQELGSDARSRLEQQGFDGIKYRNRMEGGNAYVVFNPSQVKSAIGNAGTYDPQQSSITAKLKSKLLQPKTAVVPPTHTMYHVSRRRNRASIKKLGLELRIQEFEDLERKSGIYMLETLAQAQDWAYWFGSGENQIVDIWEITLPQGYQVEVETSKDFTDIYDAWIGYEAIPPANLKLVESMQPDKKGTNPPLTGRTLKVKR